MFFRLITRTTTLSLDWASRSVPLWSEWQRKRSSRVRPTAPVPSSDMLSTGERKTEREKDTQRERHTERHFVRLFKHFHKHNLLLPKQQCTS